MQDLDDPNEIELRHGDIIFFIDESGDHSLSDDNHPLFLYGGFGVEYSKYIKLMGQWKKIKADNKYNLKKHIHQNNLLSKKAFKVFFKE